MDNLKLLLRELKNTPQGLLDLSAIPNDEITEVFDALHSLFRFDNGLQINQQLAATLSQDELEGLEQLRREFNDALVAGRVTFRRNASGRVGLSLNVE